jgi:membrane fusion protein, copper/silver efflux system
MKQPLMIGLVVLTALTIGIGLAARHADHRHVPVAVVEDDGSVRYTCAMHPEVDLDAPGNCPICGMALIPKQRETTDPGTIHIDPAMVQNLGMRTATVTRGALSAGITAQGAVMEDEQRVTVITSRTSGWVEKLLVDGTGDVVTAGQPLARLYAPALESAQQELALARKLDDASLISAAIARLRNLGIDDTDAGGRAVLRAPADGVITTLMIRDGAEVGPGMPLMTLTDLRQVWVRAEVPEAQAPGLVRGQPVSLQVPGGGSDTIAGHIDTVYPELDRDTRRVGVRVVVDNPDLRLRPGMFAQVHFKGATATPVLRVPSEALIRTGRRNTVIVAEGDGHYRPVAVTPGREVDGDTEILDGLMEGDRVVVSGQFLIDSEASLRGAFHRMGDDGAIR